MSGPKTYARVLRYWSWLMSRTLAGDAAFGGSVGLASGALGSVVAADATSRRLVLARMAARVWPMRALNGMINVLSPVDMAFLSLEAKTTY